jgi:site-specific recombinase XerC
MKKLNRKPQVSIAPATRELSRTQLSELSVVSVKRAPGERDAFAIGSRDRVVWYAEHSYRAITHWGAMRFPSADEAWAKLTELTGRVRPKKPFKQWTITVPDAFVVDPATGVAPIRRELYDTLRGVAMLTKEQ